MNEVRMGDEREPDDRAFAEAFRRAYGETPLPLPEEGRQAAAAAVSERPPLEPRGPLARGWLAPTLRLSPLVALAAGLALFAGGAFVAHQLGVRTQSLPPARATIVPSGTQRVRFVFADSHASRVAIAGDFNGWDAAATRLVRQPGGSAWSVTLELSPGWHAYAFVVDGEWVPDPTAPRAPEDYFGTPRSVIVVGDEGT